MILAVLAPPPQMLGLFWIHPFVSLELAKDQVDGGVCIEMNGMKRVDREREVEGRAKGWGWRWMNSIPRVPNTVFPKSPIRTTVLQQSVVWNAFLCRLPPECDVLGVWWFGYPWTLKQYGRRKGLKLIMPSDFWDISGPRRLLMNVLYDSVIVLVREIDMQKQLEC